MRQLEPGPNRAVPPSASSGNVVGGPGALHFRLPRRRARGPAWHPAVVFVYGFAALILLGTLLLTLPISSAAGGWTPLLDALFTATSAVCVTGLVVVDTGTYWSGFGHLVILALLQVGGVGFMTSSTALLLLGGRRATIRDRVLLREALGVRELGSVLTLARNIILFTLAAELVGALLLASRFLAEMEPGRAVWWGVFHAVSAFNNAGFDLFGEYRGLAGYVRDPALLLPLAGLILLGGISYTVVEDLARHRRFGRLALDTKLVLVTTALLTAGGTLALLFTERSPTGAFAGLDGPARLLSALFHTISRTAGFSAVDLSRMSEESLAVLMALMFIGGAAGSTAGGIKVQTFSILLFAIISSARGSAEVEAFQRRVPLAQVLRALSVALLFIALLFTIALLLTIVEGFVFHRVVFEAVSALGTVGYSTGITPETSPAGRVILIVTMFVGRLGPLTLVLALAARARRSTHRWTEETIKIG
jgi:trk system potassium uptake protein TrkH